MSYSDRVGQYDLQGFFKPDGGKHLTPLHLVVAPDVEKLPADISNPLVKAFYLRRDAVADWSARYASQNWLRDEVAALKRARLDVAFSEGAIDDEARKWARICASLVTYEAAEPYVRSLGVAVPKIKNGVTARGIAKRFASHHWWRRQFRKLFTRTAETHLREIGLVQRRKQLYASDRAVNWRRVRKSRDRALLQELEAVSDVGDQLPLLDVVEKSQANPALRRGELMLRARGFDEVAVAAGHEADFWTLTTPSAFHRTHADGRANELFEGFTVREAQAWLCKQWARVRAKLKRLSVLFYGFRIAEPHHDGTPHWHLLLFTPSQHVETLRRVIKGFWLGEYSHEQGAQQHRTKVISVDRSRGSAAGYIAKYVAKNIDGFNVGEDYEAQASDATQTVDRVSAWASAHGIRQFQQIGGPGVSVWRELRRLRGDVITVTAIEAARQAANAGQWADFITAIGGIERGRKGAIQLDTKRTGEFSQYGELRGPQIVGVSWVERSQHAEPVPTKAKTVCRMHRKFKWVEWVGVLDRIRTRTKTWRIQRKAETDGACGAAGPRSVRGQSGGAKCAPTSAMPSSSSLGPVSITVRGQNIWPELNPAYAWIQRAPFKRERKKTRGDPPCLN